MTLARPDPAISIITPTYNRCDVLARAIQSVQQQERGDYEHLIIDDGSTDGTAEMVRAINDPRIRYYQFSSQQGANAARNLGVLEAESPWISLLDSDDEFLPHRLGSMLDRIAAEPSIELYLSSFRTRKHNRETTHVNPAIYLVEREMEQALMAYALPIAGSCITVQRQLLLRGGSFAPTLPRLQDREVLLRLSQIAGIQILSDIDWVKHHSSDSISAQSSGYVEAVCQLLHLHPRLAMQYRELLGYHISRGMLNHLLQGMFSTISESWSANRRCSLLRFGMWELIRAYAQGKRVRRSTMQKLFRKKPDEAK